MRQSGNYLNVVVVRFSVLEKIPANEDSEQDREAILSKSCARNTSLFSAQPTHFKFTVLADLAFFALYLDLLLYI